MLNAIDTLGAIILTPNGMAAIGLTTAAVALVCRSGNKRRRPD